MEINEFISQLKLGETVLVEHSSYSKPELLFYGIIKESRMPVVIDDILDTLFEYYNKLKVWGYDLTVFDKVYVIKAGGNEVIGNLLGKLEVGKYVIEAREYTKIIKEVNPPIITPVLGVHKLILLGNLLENLRLLKEISTYVGNENRVAIYFVNRDVVESHSPAALKLLEEISTSVFQLNEENKIKRMK